MIRHTLNQGLKAALVLAVMAAMTLGPASLARAGLEDAAMFYDELTQYGNWVDYRDYGPVWYPTRVSANWRPYLDGRWVPSEQGWAFETGEPWAWATYHYGNWMPTEEYGWVWYPGRTWYPSTAAWRTSDDYIGWAPVPPPNYVPTQAYYPPGGYYSGMAPLDLITAPFWIFTQAASFLLGFGQPYGSAYSYYNCGCLAPYSSVPYFYPRTTLLSDCYYPSYAPGAFYFFGPRFPYVSRVTNINIATINNFVRDNDFHRFRNVVPPRRMWERHPYFRDIVPEPLREGRRFEARQAARVERVARPDVAPLPREVPRLQEPIPKAIVHAPETAAPQVLRPRAPERVMPEKAAPIEGFRGTRLPPQAERTPQEMRGHMQEQRRLQQQVPRVEQRRFQQEERQIRRQDIFREPPVQRFEAPRPKMEQPRVAPHPAPAPRSAPKESHPPQGQKGGPHEH